MTRRRRRVVRHELDRRLKHGWVGLSDDARTRTGHVPLSSGVVPLEGGPGLDLRVAGGLQEDAQFHQKMLLHVEGGFSETALVHELLEDAGGIEGIARGPTMHVGRDVVGRRVEGRGALPLGEGPRWVDVWRRAQRRVWGADNGKVELVLSNVLTTAESRPTYEVSNAREWVLWPMAKRRASSATSAASRESPAVRRST